MYHHHHNALTFFPQIIIIRPCNNIVHDDGDGNLLRFTIQEKWLINFVC